MFGDALFAVLALYVAFCFRCGTLAHLHEVLGQEGKSFIFVGVLVFSSYLLEIYDKEKSSAKKVMLLKICAALAVSVSMLSALYFMMPDVMFGRGVFLLSLCVFGVLQFLWHSGLGVYSRIPGMAKRVLILGTGPLAKHIGEVIASTNHRHVLSGYVRLANEPADVPVSAIVGDGDGLAETIKEKRVQKLVVSLSERRGIFPVRDVLDCKFSGVEVIDAPSFYEEVTGKLLIENINPSSFIFCQGLKLNASLRVYKRAFDIFFSVIGLFLALAVMPLIALMIKIDSPGPVFFGQIRVGARERRFILYKFRTMRQDAEDRVGAVWARKDDPRITRIGRLLRKTRLDEIPQLYNVFRGDMSFIGPRPERPEFTEKLKEVIPYYSERHCLKPGITGWAQVRYPYGASIEDTLEKLRYDLFYIKNVSIFLDLLIILETIKVVIFGKGGR